MVVLREDWDAEERGSRFTLRPALAISAPRGSDWMARAEAGEPVAADAISASVGPWILEPQEAIGEPEAIEGQVGRGASGWIALLEWLAFDFAAQGLAWDLVKIAVKNLWNTVGRAREESPDASFQISRGMAIALAIQQVLDAYDVAEPLECEVAEEPSSMAGHQSPELYYAGIEPWVVLLVDWPRQRRYVVVVGPDGVIRGHCQTPMGVFEGMYLRIGTGGWEAQGDNTEPSTRLDSG